MFQFELEAAAGRQRDSNMDPTFITGTNIEQIKKLNDDYLLENESEFRNRAVQQKTTRRRKLPRVCYLYRNMKKRKKIFDNKKANFLKIREYIEDNELEMSSNLVPSGVRFWTSLVEVSPKIKRPKIWIPQTFVNAGGNSQYWVWTDPKTGKICQQNDSNYQDFERALELKNGIYFEKYQNDEHRKQVESLRKKKYFVAYRRYVSDYESTTDVHPIEKWNQVRSSGSGIKDNSLVQEFIPPQGKHVSMTRLVYHTKHNKQMGANYAYKLRNKLTVGYEGEKTDKKTVRERTTVSKHVDASFTTNKMTGPGLYSLERTAAKIVNFLERAYPVRIFRIVLDFITGCDKVNYLFNVAFIDKESTGHLRTDKDEKKRTLDELTCSVYCKLCGLIFKKDEASKTLTYKLLWELSQHLKKRGRNLLDIEVSHSSTRPCRVCDLCYMVVVSEHELIELEQQFAKAQNIPIKDPYLRVPIEKKAKHRPALLSEVLKQWRFMVYLEYIYFEPEDGQMFDEFNVNLSNVHLQLKLFNIKNDFVLDLKPVDLDKDVELKKVNWGGRTVYRINLLRVYYFFSEALDITKFLGETDLYIRLTYTKDWNNYIAHGSSRTLSNFQNNRERGQKHESRVYLFFDNAKYCTLKIMAGLVCDGNFNTASMNLHKFNSIYFPDEDFYNCNMFPEEWIEIFHTKEKRDAASKREYIVKEDIQEDEERDDGSKKGDQDGEVSTIDLYNEVDELSDQIQPYTPICTKAELRKMLEGNVKRVDKQVKAKTDSSDNTQALKERLKRFKDKYGKDKVYNRFLDENGFERSQANFVISTVSDSKKKRPKTAMSGKKTKKNRIQSSMGRRFEPYREVDPDYHANIEKMMKENNDLDEEDFEDEEEHFGQEEDDDEGDIDMEELEAMSEAKHRHNMGLGKMDQQKYLKKQIDKATNELQDDL